MKISCGANNPAAKLFAQMSQKLRAVEHKTPRITRDICAHTFPLLTIMNISHGRKMNNCRSQAGYQPQ